MNNFYFLNKLDTDLEKSSSTLGHDFNYFDIKIEKDEAQRPIKCTIKLTYEFTNNNINKFKCIMDLHASQVEGYLEKKSENSNPTIKELNDFLSLENNKGNNDLQHSNERSVDENFEREILAFKRSHSFQRQYQFDLQSTDQELKKNSEEIRLM